MIYELTMQFTCCQCWGLGFIFLYDSGILRESHCTQIVLIKTQNTKTRPISPSNGTADTHATLKYLNMLTFWNSTLIMMAKPVSRVYWAIDISLSTSVIFYHRTVTCGRTKRNYVPDSNHVSRRFKGKVAGRTGFLFILTMIHLIFSYLTAKCLTFVRFISIKVPCDIWSGQYNTPSSKEFFHDLYYVHCRLLWEGKW